MYKYYEFVLFMMNSLGYGNKRLYVPTPHTTGIPNTVILKNARGGVFL